VTDYPGLFFVGLPWLHNAKSGLIYGVGEDAAYIAQRIACNDRQIAVRCFRGTFRRSGICGQEGNQR
jgi:hypothetical protein